MNDTEVETKVCIACGDTKSVSMFFRDSRLIGGRAGKCKACMRKAKASLDGVVPPYEETAHMIGKRFGILTVVKCVGRTRGVLRWECLCDCGQMAIRLDRGLKKNASSNCGCLNRKRLIESIRIHGMSRTPLHRIWMGMIRRCHCDSNKSFYLYGARGISVCERWRSAFTHFAEDMGPRPSPKHTLDRIDNDGHYEPGNCRWAKMDEQSRNTRRTRLFTHNGKTQCMKDWAKELGVHYVTLRQRIERYDGDFVKAIGG